ncbi:hypothetical protein M9Y10_000262, partial [Tritrichomonas musculus]
MLDQLICQFELMKDEIKEIKQSSTRKFDEQRQLIDEQSSNLQEEIEELRREINQITRNNIPNLNQNINRMKRKMRDHKTQGENIEHNLQDEIRKIKEEIVNLKDDQENKADKIYVTDFENNQQTFQERYDEEKMTIQDDLLKLKEKINKINKFVRLLDTNKTIFGTTCKVTKFLHDEEILGTSDFEDELSEFSHFNVEIEYPSESFEAIYSEVLSLKRSKKTELTISIFVTGSTNKYFKGNKEI